MEEHLKGGVTMFIRSSSHDKLHIKSVLLVYYLNIRAVQISYNIQFTVGKDFFPVYENQARN